MFHPSGSIVSFTLSLVILRGRNTEKKGEDTTACAVYILCVPPNVYSYIPGTQTSAWLTTECIQSFVILHTVSYLIPTVTLCSFYFWPVSKHFDFLRTSNLTNDTISLDLNPALSTVRGYAISAVSELFRHCPPQEL